MRWVVGLAIDGGRSSGGQRVGRASAAGFGVTRAAAGAVGSAVACSGRSARRGRANSAWVGRWSGEARRPRVAASGSRPPWRRRSERAAPASSAYERSSGRRVGGPLQRSCWAASSRLRRGRAATETLIKGHDTVFGTHKLVGYFPHPACCTLDSGSGARSPRWGAVGTIARLPGPSAALRSSRRRGRCSGDHSPTASLRRVVMFLTRSPGLPTSAAGAPPIPPSPAGFLTRSTFRGSVTWRSLAAEATRRPAAPRHDGVPRGLPPYTGPQVLGSSPPPPGAPAAPVGSRERGTRR